nr:immunoglobulin light chain junction region [Macaca mulatta]
CLQGYSTPITF